MTDFENKYGYDEVNASVGDGTASPENVATNAYGDNAENSDYNFETPVAENTFAEDGADIAADTFEDAAAGSDFAEDKGKKRGGKEKTARGDKQKKKSGSTAASALTAVSVVLIAIPFLVMLGMALATSIGAFNLTPYYSFWPFLGCIIILLLGIAFLAISLTVFRKKSRRSIRYQTISVVIAFVALSTGFGILMNVAFPDVINMATQGTLHTEDLYYRGEEQLQKNALLDRQFIMYNLIKGNLGGEYSYQQMSKRTLLADTGEEVPVPTTSDKLSTMGFRDEFIDNWYKEYMKDNNIDSVIKGLDGSRLELYNFIYNSYVLADYDYALKGLDKNLVRMRQSFALAMTDKCLDKYNVLCKEGYNNPTLAELRDQNYESMNHDGYNAYDDPLLLLAQQTGRMTVPVIIRLILDDRYTVSEPVVDENGNYTEYIYYKKYDKDFVDKQMADKGLTFDADGKCIDGKYIYYENGMYEAPQDWSVLDMLGDPMSVLAGMDLTGISLEVAGIDLGSLLTTVVIPKLDETGIVGNLLENIVGDVVEEATGGAKLGLMLYIDDNGGLGLQLNPASVDNAILGYMQMTYIDSNHLLMGVINLMGARNILFFIGALGVVMIIGGCLLREYGKKLKEEKAEAQAQDLSDEDADKAFAALDNQEGENG